MLALHTLQPDQAAGLTRLGSFLRLEEGSRSGHSRSSRGAPQFYYGRSVHGRSVASDPSGRHGASAHGGRSLHGGSIAEDGGAASDDSGLPGEAAGDRNPVLPIATPHAERLQKLLRVLQLNQVRGSNNHITLRARSRRHALDKMTGQANRVRSIVR